MKDALRDLKVLWATRNSSGFPWPFQTPTIRMLVLGYEEWSCIPLWKQVITIPLRPWRYAKMVRGVARTRNFPYAPHEADSVP